jgi:hypothetical protein
MEQLFFLCFYFSEVFTVLLGAVLSFRELAFLYIRAFILSVLFHHIEYSLVVLLFQIITSAN